MFDLEIMPTRWNKAVKGNCPDGKSLLVCDWGSTGFMFSIVLHMIGNVNYFESLLCKTITNTGLNPNKRAIYTEFMATKQTNALPELLLKIKCSADCIYDTQQSEQYGINPEPITAKKYTLFTHPGTYMPDESVDAIVEYIARFSIKDICIITHTICGLLISMREQIDPSRQPTYFGSASERVVKELNQYGISNDQMKTMDDIALGKALGELVCLRISKKLVEKAISERAKHAVEPNNRNPFLELDEVNISAAIQHESEQTPTVFIRSVQADGFTGSISTLQTS